MLCSDPRQYIPGSLCPSATEHATLVRTGSGDEPAGLRVGFGRGVVLAGGADPPLVLHAGCPGPPHVEPCDVGLSARRENVRITQRQHEPAHPLEVTFQYRAAAAVASVSVPLSVVEPCDVRVSAVV